MAEVVVRPVRTKREQRQFIDLSWSLYRGDPNWIPPLRMNLEELVGFRRHPFHDNNRTEAFLAWRGNEPVGRIQAIVNLGYIQQYHERRGFFGFFEAVDDQQVADALFDAARAWLGAQGLPAMRGPANPSLNYECGLLVDGFDSPPTFMMTYNPPYYPRLIESCGFKKARDLYAYVGTREQLPAIQERLSPIADVAAEHCQATIRPMNRRHFKRDVELFLQLYNQGMVQTWSFSPLPNNEIDSLAKGLQFLLVPELTLFAEVEGRTVGAILGLLDYNPRIKAIDGRLFPFGFIRLLWGKRGIKRVRVLSIAVVPEFQRWGLGLVLMRGLVPKSMEMGIQEAEFSWILEDNTLARKGLEKGGAKIDKTFRIYDYDPPGSAVAGT